MLEIKGQLVLYPVEFNEKVANDPVFRNSIAGFSCISLSHVLNGYQRSRFSVPRFSENRFVYIDLCPDVYRQVFNEESRVFGQEDKLEEVLDVMSSNRTYGEWGATIDFLLRQPGAPRSVLHLIDWEVPTYLHNRMSMSPSDFEVFMKSRSFTMEKAEKVIKRMFPENEQLSQVLVGLKRRKGVQIVYGEKKELIEFLKKNDPISVDGCAVELQRKIPARLVKAIIPLGEYEQQVLLN